MEEERPIPKGPVAAAVAAAVASAARVFLFRLPCGRPMFVPSADIEIGAGVVEATVSARQGSGGDR
jgi:hypothetical protein